MQRHDEDDKSNRIFVWQGMPDEKGAAYAESAQPGGWRSCGLLGHRRSPIGVVQRRTAV